MTLFRAVFLAGLSYAQLVHAADGLVLAPGQSVTLVDASDPTMHAVVTAPNDSQLDLSRLLQANGKASILSIVTAAQVKHAGELVANADGSVSIGAATNAAPPVDAP